ncbi:MAG: opacity protein-like surface antigen [Yoonia sp.]|jgi:opacity protein-like surface antigen
MLRQITLTSTLILGTSSAAIAGGITEPVIVAAPAPVMMAPVIISSDWTGFYAGGSLGLGTVGIGDAADIDTNNYGVHAGYLYDMGSIVLGGELEYSTLDFDALGDSTDASVLRLKGRVGYDVGAFLPYLTAGVAQLTIEDGSDVKDSGYFYGVGVDYAINDSIRVGGEILQHEFEDFNGGGADISAQTMSLRVAYSF